MAFSSPVHHGREEGGGDEAGPMPQRAIVHGEQSEPRSRSLPTSCGAGIHQQAMPLLVVPVIHCARAKLARLIYRAPVPFPGSRRWADRSHPPAVYERTRARRRKRRHQLEDYSGMRTAHSEQQEQASSDMRLLQFLRTVATRCFSALPTTDPCLPSEVVTIYLHTSISYPIPSRGKKKPRPFHSRGTEKPARRCTASAYSSTSVAE